METVLIYVLAFAIIVWLMASNHARDKRIAVLERRVRQMTDELGLTDAAPARIPEVVQHLEAGRNSLAVKAYREATGVSLRKANDAVAEISASVATDAGGRRRRAGRPA